LKEWLETNVAEELVPHTYSRSALFAIPKTTILKHQDDIRWAYQQHSSRKRNTPRDVKGREMPITDQGYRIFDSVELKDGQYWVVSTNPVVLSDLSGNQLYPKEQGKSCPPKNVPYVAQKGRTRLRVDKVQITELGYEVLRDLAYECGERNLRVFDNEDCFILLVRNGMVLENREGYEELLRSYVIDGTLFKEDGNRIIIGDQLQRVTISLLHSEVQRLL